MPVHESADVSPAAHVSPTATVWHLAQIREDAHIGSRVIIGRGAYVGPGVRIGDNCKLQNYALVYEPAELGDGVFVGPGAVLTNDRHPRAVHPDGSRKGPDAWDLVGVRVLEGASIGARAVCTAPATIGRWAMIAAGSVVAHDVPDFALMVGVPARRIGWVGRAGFRLDQVPDSADAFTCPETGARYREIEPGHLVEEAAR